MHLRFQNICWCRNKALRQGIEYFIGFYNFNRLHSALNHDKPMNVYMPALRKEA